MSCSVYVVAGEVSGDTHGAELMEALQFELGEVVFRGLGGKAMAELAEAGVSDWVDEAAVVGFTEVIRRYGWFRERFDRVLREIRDWKPEILLLVDYPGFNLRLAKQVKEFCPETKIVHYVAPQVWAWNQKRIPQIAASHDLMLCLFPFEVPFFQQAGLKTSWVGHPLVDELEEKRISESREDGVVGLFPGSRRKEVSRIFPLMLETVKLMRKREKTPILFRTAAASERVQTMMQDLLAKSEIPEEVVEIQLGQSQRLMQQVSLGVVASGTATLEAAYYGLPYCLVYRVAWPTFLMARHLVKLPHIGLINILAGREVVPEFIQNDANSYELAGWLGRYLEHEHLRKKLHKELLEEASKLGEAGVHRRAAHEISKLVTK